MRYATIIAVILSAAFAVAADDPVKERLDQARVAHDTELEKARLALLAIGRQKEEAAQKAGDLTQLKRVRGDREGFEERGELPKAFSVAEYMAAVGRARDRLKTAYVQARREYTKAGRVADAEAIDVELERLRGEKNDVPTAAQKPKKVEVSTVDPRVQWVHSRGYVIKARGGDWFESIDGRGELFMEIERTKDHILIKHASRQLWLRIFDGTCQAKFDDGPFSDFYSGGWDK